MEGRRHLAGIHVALIATSFFLELVRYHRVGAVKQRLYTENLFAIPLPEFSRNFQDSVVRLRNGALKTLATLKDKLDGIERDIGHVIAGTLMVGWVTLVVHDAHATTSAPQCQPRRILPAVSEAN